MIDRFVVPLRPDFLFLFMRQGELFNLVVDPLSLDR